MISPASPVWHPSQNLAQLPQDVIVLGIARIAQAIGRPEAAAVGSAMGGDIIVVSWGAQGLPLLPRPAAPLSLSSFPASPSSQTRPTLDSRVSIPLPRTPRKTPPNHVNTLISTTSR